MERCGVLIFSEKIEWIAGLVETGRSIADGLGEKLGLVLVAVGQEDECPGMARGVDHIYKFVPDNPKDKVFPETLAAGLEFIADSLHTAVLLTAASPTGKEAASRLAAARDSACVTDCLTVYVDQDKNMVAEKPLFGGVVTAEIEVRGDFKVCAINPDALAKPAEDNGPAGNDNVEITHVFSNLPGLPEITKEILAVQPVEKTVDLVSAKKIVSIGRGLRKQEDLSLVKELCQVLNAELGCSRPVAEELKWLPEERKVGLSGITVKPEVYIAIGISGQVQHLTGMKDSRLVIAINNDKKAPFLQMADYGLVGDLYQVIPELITALR